VDVADGGQPRADVEELVDALPGQDGDSAAQEGAVGAGGERAVRGYTAFSASKAARSAVKLASPPSA